MLLVHGSTHELAQQLETSFDIPVVEETGIIGLFDLDLNFSHMDVPAATVVLREKFGLGVMEASRQIDMLLIEEHS